MKAQRDKLDRREAELHRQEYMGKKKHEAAYAGLIWPTTKPDVSNIVKGIEDALNGIWYKDDSQIVHEYSMKQYAREPGVIVKMWGGNEDETID